jgi:serine/threonine protein kinase
MRPAPEITPGSVLPARLPKGFVVDEHVVDGWLRDGGMAAIYRAHRISDGRRVALKLQLPSTAHDQAIGERFEREAELMWRIRGSPHVVELLDVGVLDDGRRYLLMEWVEGEDLEDLLDFLRNQDERLSIPRACRIGRDVARGLAALHGHGVAHLDLKPANVMIGWGEDGGDVIELVDFGIAADLRDSTEPSSEIAGGRLMGTSRYMSPQQARGLAPSPSFDVYALGVLLFESLSGSRVPPDGWTPETLPRVDALRKQVPTALAELVRACMDFDPERRPASATAVVEALDGILARLDAAAEVRTRSMEAITVRSGGTDIMPRSGVLEVSDGPELPEIPAGLPVWDELESPSDEPAELPELPEVPPVRTGSTEVTLRYEEVLSSCGIAPAPAPAPAPAAVVFNPAWTPRQELPGPAVAMVPTVHVGPRAPQRERRGRWPWLQWAVAAGVVVVLGGTAAAWLPRGEQALGDEIPEMAAMGQPAAPSDRSEPRVEEQGDPSAMGDEDGVSVPPAPKEEVVEPSPEPEPEPEQTKEVVEPSPEPEPEPAAAPTDKARKAPRRAAGPSAEACEALRTAATDAKKARAWSTVLQKTARRSCWTTSQQRLERSRLRVEAYAERGELRECVKEAGQSRDREIMDRAGFCKKSLAGGET